MKRLLKFLHIIDSCPNCEGAWTGGSPSPETLTHCVTCGNKRSEITGWVWGKLVDPFCWIGQRITARNLKYLYPNATYITVRNLYNQKHCL